MPSSNARMRTIKNLKFHVTTPFKKMPKQGFHSGLIMWVSYFRLWVAGIVPIIFHDVSVGSHYPFKRYRVPHFLPNHIHFSRFTPIFVHLSPVIVLCTPVLAVFMLRASLLTPNFFSFYLSGCLWHPSDVTVFNRQWLRDAATTKNWVPSKNLSFGPPLW